MGFKEVTYKGGHLYCSDDWIVLENVLMPKDVCRNVGVIEIRNSEKRKAPHFIFFSNKSVHDLMEDEIQTVYRACEEAYPDFKKILEEQIEPPDFSDEDFSERAKEHLESPYIGMFDLYVIREREESI